MQGQEVTRFLGHGGYVFCLAIDGSGSLVASGAADEGVRIWDIRSGGSALVDGKDNGGSSGTGAGAGGIGGAKSGGGGCLRALSAHSEPVTAVDFSPDGSCLASSSYDGVM
jgi:COMPASS component SWD3